MPCYSMRYYTEMPENCETTKRKERKMSDIKKAFSEEIRRLSRKELKGSLETLHKSLANQRQIVADLKRQLKSLEKAVAQAGISAVEEVKDVAGTGKAVVRRITGKRILAMRKKMGLSQVQFSVLAGVSLPSIVNWEGGKSEPRSAQKEKLAEIRSIGKREIARRLSAAGLEVKRPRKAAVKDQKKKAAAVAPAEVKAKAVAPAAKDKPAETKK